MARSVASAAPSLPSTPELPPALQPWLALLKPLLLLAGVAAAVALGVTAALWSRAPQQAVLFTGLTDADAAAISDSLRTAGMPVQIGPAPGVIQVPGDRLNDARMHLARNGVGPQEGGLSRLSEPQGFGVSSFLESARYHHALEQELARTISALRPVNQARVHLALPKPSAFVRDRAPATASVVLELLPGAQLAAGQAEAIARLVASSIPELRPEAVTVVDARGGLLSQTDSASAQVERHFDLARRTESLLVSRVQTLLEPLVGRAEVQVMVALDHTEAEQALERVDPQGVVRQEHVTRERRDARPGAVGVPGAATNLPVEAPPESGAGTSEAETLTTQERRQFDVSRELAYTRNRGGAIERLSVAVLLDRPVDAEGVAGFWEADTLADVEALVRDAVGYDEARGDRVTVRQGQLRVTPAPEVQPLPLWQQAWVPSALRDGVGLLALLFIAWFVLRPLLRQLGGRPPVVEGVLEPALEGDAGRLSEDRLSLGRDDGPQPMSFEEKLSLARQAVAQDPKRVAQVVKTWVGSDG